MNYLPILLALTLPVAAAHEVVSYGSISAEFHTDAGEHLRVGDDTLVGFRLLVEGKEVDAADCDCQLLLYRGKPSARIMPQVIELEAGFDNAKAAEGWARAEAEGLYTLVLAGKPRGAGQFDPFRIEYPLHAYQDVFSAPTSTAPQAEVNPQASPSDHAVSESEEHTHE